jgi:hypothetical protein
MKVQTSVTAVVLLAASSSAVAIEPVDKELISEARTVLGYLESIYGKKTIAGGRDDGSPDQNGARRRGGTVNGDSQLLMAARRRLA